MVVVANSLTKLEALFFDFSEVSQGVTSHGKLPILKKLCVERAKTKDWTAIVLAKQLRRLTLLDISKEPLKFRLYSSFMGVPTTSARSPS